MKLYVVTLVLALVGFAGSVAGGVQMLPGYSLHQDGWFRMKLPATKPTAFPKLITKQA